MNRSALSLFVVLSVGCGSTTQSPADVGRTDADVAQDTGNETAADSKTDSATSESAVDTFVDGNETSSDSSNEDGSSDDALDTTSDSAADSHEAAVCSTETVTQWQGTLSTAYLTGCEASPSFSFQKFAGLGDPQAPCAPTLMAYEIDASEARGGGGDGTHPAVCYGVVYFDQTGAGRTQAGICSSLLSDSTVYHAGTLRLCTGVSQMTNTVLYCDIQATCVNGVAKATSFSW